MKGCELIITHYTVVLYTVMQISSTALIVIGMISGLKAFLRTSEMNHIKKYSSWELLISFSTTTQESGVRR